MKMETNFTKYINDPIHGYIALDSEQLKFIDTPQFQRLRELHQLGSSYFVFPGASHRRFEHSIGVSDLSRQMVTHLRDLQHELEITDNEISCVKIAGLCHDLGHGPFSHIFDRVFIPKAIPGSTWTHEQGSEMLLDALIDEAGIEIFGSSEIRFIKSLIEGKPLNPSSSRNFLYDVVANKRNSIDVDKFDYLQRDCYNVGLKSSYDHTRLILFSRVIDNQICFSHKESYNIYELFHTRYSLFKRVYTHKVAKAIELMIVDALLEANNVLDISDAIFDAKQYTMLTDSVLNEIQKAKDERLLKSKALIDRIKKRQLYKLVEEYAVPDILKEYFTTENITSFAISKCGSTLKENDVIVDFNMMNYGMKDKNPVDYTKFFGKWNLNEAFNIEHDRINYLIPEKYEETSIRIYARDPEKVPAVQKAFNMFMSEFMHDLGNTIRNESPEKADMVPTYSPNVLNVVPNEKVWMKYAEERGWSPKKPARSTSNIRRNSTSLKTSIDNLAQEFADF